MTDYDAIVVGAGHNGLTAAALLQRAGLHTLCLEAATYAGGMAATVELIDGFRYEIAGSVQFPTAGEITKDLGHIAHRGCRRDVGQHRRGRRRSALTELIGADHLSAELAARLQGRDHCASFVQIPPVHDHSLAPPGKHAASAYAYAFPVETPRDQHGHLKNEMARRVIDKISR